MYLGSCEKSLENFQDYSSASFVRYIDALRKSSGKSVPIEEMKCNLIKMGSMDAAARLTVAIRTQGTRFEELSDVLSCLYAQDCDEFKVIIVGHNCKNKNAKSLIEFVENYSGFFKDRISLVLIEGGGRSRPLNAALQLSDTEYIAFLDDDDLVFSNWVSTFIDRFETCPGQIVHSFTYTQPWIRFESVGGRSIAASGPASPTYFSPFDYMGQLQVNSCPIMSLAFPLHLIKQFGLHFDESLSTVEDWDFLMRAVQICGVVDAPVGTSIYRIWESGDSSHHLHDEDEWERNRQYVQNKLSKMMLLMPGGSLVYAPDPVKVDLPIQLISSFQALFIDEALDEDDSVPPSYREYCVRDFTNHLEFACNGRTAQRISVRLKRGGQFKIDKLRLRVVCSCGAVLDFSSDDVESDAYELTPGELSFIRSSSIFSVQLPERLDIDRVEVSFRYYDYINEDLLSGTKLIVRLKQWTRKLFGKVA